MNYRYIFLLVVLSIGFVVISHAQITNLMVNGSSTSFAITSGDKIGWVYNIPNGATANGELWYDVNGNGIIEPDTDVARFIFTQTDGDTNGNGGPPDMDGTANGQVTFSQALGFAPGKYIFKLTHNAVSQSVTGTCLALGSPAHTISGTVTPPAGKSAQHIFVTVQRSEHAGNPNFWDAITDGTGLYTIELNSDTAGNPWNVRIENNPYPPNIITPNGIDLTITGNHTNNNFSFLAAAAQVAGTLKDESGTPIPNLGVELMRNDGVIQRKERNTSGSGFFQVGLLSSDLNGQTWTLQTECNCNNGITGSQLIARASLPVINSNDSLFRQLVIYNANAQIQGQVQVNGSAPGFPIQVVAQNADTAQAGTQADSGTGNFTLNVTNKIYNYSLFPVNLPSNYQSSNVTAHPGQSGVIIDITITDVKERATGIPSEFALMQNYPNPFNPSTRIQYDIPTASHVRLSITNILGQEVERLVDREQQPGKYEAVFDAARLSSGVYFYRLTAGSYTSVKKMLLMR
ncbi:MAG: T9SS type A sorting domain-containing protein [Ignavibacteriae bacterium]|nr:T9SS type A sorting domain-containing protein [Ignavibacteria bacterium]MBI3363818.1 T9SS type A sorting domain-containing protein [Ignavibacteriota bacterium]